jgi:glycosyltransferase involved in cell wall biosynthesis
MGSEAGHGTPTSAVRRPPCLPDIGVIALVSDEWETPWQPRHQVLVRLAEYFNVVWCIPAPSWRTWRHRAVPRNERNDYGPPIAQGLTIYRPESWLPEVGRPRFLAHWTRQQRLRRAQRILLNRLSRKIILYLWRPSYGPALDLVDHDLSCYHIDDEYTFSEVEKPIDKREAWLIGRVDQVFIHSPALLEKKGKLNPRTAFVPNGVDYCAYATPHSEPADLAPIPRPRIGYVGRIKRQLDLSLLITLARRHKEWSFVFVGPQSGIDGHAALLQELSLMSNVYFLGGKPVDALPAYTQHLDVCMLCYAVNDYTKFIYPLKLHEYLASGRPVVGSPIRSFLEFAHIIRLARTTDEWSQALNDSLAPAACSVAQVDARRSIARQHDWDRLVRLIAHTLCDRLGPEYLERFEQIPFRDQGVASLTAI